MKISVITVSYNSEKTIADTITSVAKQTYRNVEHLVIDGKSSDNTIKIVEACRHQGLIVSSEPDGGIYDAMNKGLDRARGEIIGFLNSDDFYADETVLEKIAETFQDKSIDVCFADLVYITPDKKRIVRYWKSQPFVKGVVEKGWAPAHPTFYVRKSLIDKLGKFDISYKFAADFDFMVRYLEVGGVRSAYIPYTLVRMRVGGVSNKSLLNIIKQNKEIYFSMIKNGIRYNFLKFWAHKVTNRMKQYILAHK